jgi:hypothetical protein
MGLEKLKPNQFYVVSKLRNDQEIEKVRQHFIYSGVPQDTIPSIGQIKRYYAVVFLGGHPSRPPSLLLNELNSNVWARGEEVELPAPAPTYDSQHNKSVLLRLRDSTQELLDSINEALQEV